MRSPTCLSWAEQDELARETEEEHPQRGGNHDLVISWIQRKRENVSKRNEWSVVFSAIERSSLLRYLPRARARWGRALRKGPCLPFPSAMCLLIAPLSLWLWGLQADRPRGVEQVPWFFWDWPEETGWVVFAWKMGSQWWIVQDKVKNLREPVKSLVLRDLGSWPWGRTYPRSGDIQLEANAMVGWFEKKYHCSGIFKIPLKSQNFTYYSQVYLFKDLEKLNNVLIN